MFLNLQQLQALASQAGITLDQLGEVVGDKEAITKELESQAVIEKAEAKKQFLNKLVEQLTIETNQFLEKRINEVFTQDAEKDNHLVLFGIASVLSTIDTRFSEFAPKLFAMFFPNPVSSGRGRKPGSKNKVK